MTAQSHLRLTFSLRLTHGTHFIINTTLTVDPDDSCRPLIRFGTVHIDGQIISLPQPGVLTCLLSVPAHSRMTVGVLQFAAALFRMQRA